VQRGLKKANAKAAAAIPASSCEFPRSKYRPDAAPPACSAAGMNPNVEQFINIAGHNFRLLGVVPEAILLPGLAAILVFSAYKVWGHK
jgi:hypothetical protein